MTAEGPAFEEGTRGDDASCKGQHKQAGAKRILHHTPDMIAPGNHDEECIDDPNTIFFQEARDRTVVADKFLNQIVDRCERANGAPETPEE